MAILKVEFKWDDRYGPCYDCGAPAAYAVEIDKGDRANPFYTAEMTPVANRRCSVCAAYDMTHGTDVETVMWLFEEDFADGVPEVADAIVSELQACGHGGAVQPAEQPDGSVLRTVRPEGPGSSAALGAGGVGPSEQDDVTRRLYDAADDDEANTLDRLRDRAGITWTCPIEPWTNLKGEPCEDCGRTEDEARAESTRRDSESRD